MKIGCKLKGHNLESITKSNLLIKEYACSACGKKFTTDGYGNLVKLNSYWAKNNLFFEKNYKTAI